MKKISNKLTVFKFLVREKKVKKSEKLKRVSKVRGKKKREKKGKFSLNFDYFKNKLKFKQLYTAFRRASTGLQFGLTMANTGARMGSQIVPYQWFTWWQWVNVWIATKWWFKSTPWSSDIIERRASWGTCMDATNRSNKVSWKFCDSKVREKMKMKL